jgi:hypothetical protein
MLSAKRLLLVPVVFSILPGADSPALAQRAVATSVGPGRIVCNASFCELGIGEQPVQRVRVIASHLPEDDTRRLRKCTGVSRPCVVTVDGIEQGDPTKIMATRIAWQD